MIDYNEVQRLTDQGIEAFSGGGSFEIIITGAGKKIVNGEEVVIQEVRGTVYGAVRAISQRYVDGETILQGDKRAFFSNVTPIENGMIIILEGKHWRVIDNRPVNPTQGHVIAYRPILRKVASHG
ncbi:putative virion structural protein [Klebsiella phage vB_KaeD_HazelMika]|nr:putative virion structural protein [Klebsiella phage vB_KaeD_HazelMika]